MMTYGYAIEYRYTGEGTLEVKTRVPAIHGPMHPEEANGMSLKTYTQECDLPWYESLLLPHTPNYGDVVCLISNSETNPDFLVIGITGGNYGNMALKN